MALARQLNGDTDLYVCHWPETLRPSESVSCCINTDAGQYGWGVACLHVKGPMGPKAKIAQVEDRGTKIRLFLLWPFWLTFLWGDLYHAEVHEEWQNEPIRHANVWLRAWCVRSPKLLASGTQKGIVEVHSSWHIWSCHGVGGEAKKISYLIRKRERAGFPLQTEVRHKSFIHW